MKVHFYQIYFKEREEQYEENLVEYFLSTIFMANVVAMAGTCDDYNIETRNDNVSQFKEATKRRNVPSHKTTKKSKHIKSIADLFKRT